MAGRNMAVITSLRLIDIKSPKWNCLVPLLHRLSFYSSASRFSSSLCKGKDNKTKSMPTVVPHETRSYFLNFSTPRFYDTFVKPHIDIDPVVIKPKKSILRMQDDNLEEGFLSSELPSHPKLIRGQLKNGLCYCILPHTKHANRFEAHMVVHVGSIHEEEDEQGIAHMTEHVIHTDKSSRLYKIGVCPGARMHFSLTDYYAASQTVLEHFDKDIFGEDLVDGDLVPYVLDLLKEETFKPKILASYLEKQRHIVLSELQMLNSIDDRIELQLCQHLHSENKLSKRRTLGLEDQIKKWSVSQIKKFHKRWYFPGNATLYIVGDINVSKIIDAIQAKFGRVRNKRSSEILKNEWPLTFHHWSLPRSNMDDQKHPQIFHHKLIHKFSFYIYSKIPINKFQTYGDLRSFLMKQIYLSVLRCRIYAKYKSSNSSSRLMELLHEDYFCYGCALTNLSITSEAKDWKTAIKIALHEVRRLKELGINYGEFCLHKEVILKDSAPLIAVHDKNSPGEIVDFLMDKDALGHRIMEQREAHQSIASVATTITLEEVNSIGSKLLEFVSDFGKPSAPVPTTIMACAPTTHEDEKGELVEFTINPSDIESVIKQGLEELIFIEPEIEVPTELISSSQLQKLWLERHPTFIPLISSRPNVKKLKDEGTGITQRRLSNGISVNYKISKNDSGEAIMRVIIGGGRALESSDLKGAIAVGVQTLFEGGCVGHFSREQVERFCLKNMIRYYMKSTEEFISMEFVFESRDDGMQAAFQLLHMFLEHGIWLEEAFDRAKQIHLSNFESNLKNLEKSTTRTLMLAMLDGDERFAEPTQNSLQNLTLKSVKDVVLNQFTGNNMEVSIVGDFSEEDVESSIINYLGTVKATENFKKELHQCEPIMCSPTPSHLQSEVFVKDTEERTYACVAGLVPNIWGFNIDGKHCLDSHSRFRDHPLFFGVTMEFVTFIIDDTLRRDVIASGLAYNVELDLRLFQKLNLGWYMISLISTPYKVRKTVDVCKKVLKDFGSEEISQKYLDQVRGFLLKRHEDNTKSNAYWLKLLCQLHASSAPIRKDISCIKDVGSLYKDVRIEDVNFAYNQLKVNDNSIYSCIGISGQDSFKFADISAQANACFNPN